VSKRSGKAASSVEDLIDRLYALDPDEFTEKRNAAAKQLRAAGDREGSDRIKALKKPTAVAWAVNQLSRRRPELVDDLLDAGAQLRSAQRAALSGSEKGGLREATQARRAAVGPLLDEAAAVFADAGRSGAAHVDAIRSTLEAASSDEETGDLLRAGRLVKEIVPSSGLGDISGFEVLIGGRATGPAPKATRGRAKKAAPKKEPEESAAARKVRERLAARLAKAEDAVMAARGKAADARVDAEATAKEADRLEREFDTARRRAERSARAAASAESKFRESERALEKVQADLAELS
jgi:hypothetical protein